MNNLKRLIRNNHKHLVQLFNIANYIHNKRGLCKLAVGDYEKKLIKALDMLTDDNKNGPIKDLLSDIRQYDSKYLYNGPVFRKFSFSNSVLNYSNIIDSPDHGGPAISKKELEMLSRDLIETGQAQSTSKNLKVCEEFDSDGFRFKHPLEVTIKFEAKDGIDIIKLAEGYIEELKIDLEEGDKSAKDLIATLEGIVHWYGHEEEVFVEVPNDYDIVQFGNIDINNLDDLVSLDIIMPK